MKDVKIIATYGPSLAAPGVLLEAMKRIDVLRVNFSHNDERSWDQMEAQVLKAIEDSGREVKLLADLCGPKIRLGAFGDDVMVKKGDKVYFEYSPKAKSDSIPVGYENLYKDAIPGATIIIGDGEPRFEVDKVEGKRIRCISLSTGEVKQKKGIWMGGAHISIPNPTETDLRIAKFVEEEGFDYLALSFAVNSEQIRTLRKVARRMPIIAKVESRLAVRNIDDIAKEADMIMVARGDLGLDMPFEDVPAAQREIIAGAKRNGKQFIVATQALINMVNAPIPTRAEVNDMANGVLSGADYLMLSEETAAGKYPLEAIDIMERTIRATESASGL